MLNIIYMGTPDFAVPPLEAILAAGHSVKAVFTQPDRPVGRGYKLTPPPVKQCAEKNGIPVFQPQRVKDGDAENIIKETAPDVIVVAAYGMILPQSILDIPRLGCINIHASLLPAWRGAAPIQQAILNGDRVSGVTAMQMAAGLDSGDILDQSETAIDADDTFETLHDKLSALGAELIVKTLDKAEKGLLCPRPQGDEFTYAPIIKKSQGKIDFAKPAAEINNMVRAFEPWPSAFTSIGGRRLKICRAAVSDKTTDKPCGTVIAENGSLSVTCGGGTVLDLLTVQAEGSKRMNAADFLRGHAICTGDRLGDDD